MSNHVTSLHNYLARTHATSTLSWAESSTGPNHEVVWTVQCKIGGIVKGTGTASTINDAKQLAAQQALAAIKPA